MAKKFLFPFRPKLFKGYTMRGWYLTDEESEDEDNTDGDDSEDDGDDEDSTITVEVDGTTYTFSTTYDTDAEATAADAVDEDPEAVFTEDMLGTDYEYLTYLGTYNVTSTAGESTLASPTEVEDTDAISAIVLHYNATSGEWEQVNDVTITDGYVYAVFTSLSPVAVYTVKSAYEATVTIGEEVTNYGSIVEACNYAVENIASSPTVTLMKDVTVTETLNIISQTDCVMTIDLNGHTLTGSVTDGYVITANGTGSTEKAMVCNGTIVADENTNGVLYAYNNYVAVENAIISSVKAGGYTLYVDSTRVYPTDCTVSSTDGYCAFVTSTSAAAILLTKNSTLIQTNTSDTASGNYAIYVNGDNYASTININEGTVIEADEVGVCCDSKSSKIYIGGSANITAPTAVILTATSTYKSACYTGTGLDITVNGDLVTSNTSETEGFAFKCGTYTATLKDAWIPSGYKTVVADGLTTVEELAIVEYTTASGTTGTYNALSSSAVSKAGTGGTLKLLEDTTITGLTLSLGITLDLNGHTITTTGSSGIYNWTKDIDVTIKNGTVIGTSTTSGSSCILCGCGTMSLVDMTVEAAEASGTLGVVVGYPSKDNAATMTISGNSNISATGSAIFVQTMSGTDNVSTLTIEDGVTATAPGFALSGNGTYDGTVITINGGTFISTGNGAALYHPQNGELTINGGTFTGVVTGIQMCDGNLYFNNGTVTVTGEDDTLNKTGDGNIPDACAISVVNRSGYSATYPTATIVGGTFKSANGKAVKAYAWSSNAESTWDATDYVNISGGSFSDIPDSSYLATGYVCSTEATDGLYTVSASN